jgi:hypothetical protein
VETGRGRHIGGPSHHGCLRISLGGIVSSAWFRTTVEPNHIEDTPPSVNGPRSIRKGKVLDRSRNAIPRDGLLEI